MSLALSQHPSSLAELLDARPDTRETISANLELAHACLELKRGDAAAAERLLEQERAALPPELETVATCIRAESLRLSGKLHDAWDLAEELVARDRFDTVAALYLRFLFPLRGMGASSVAAATTAHASAAPPEPSVQTPDPAPAEPPRVDSPESVAVAHSFHEPDSEISLSLENEDAAADPADATPTQSGTFPASLAKVGDDSSVRLLRLRAPDGSESEIVRGTPPAGDLDTWVVERPSTILSSLGFGRLVHASFEGACGATHVWARSGRLLHLVVDDPSSAPALAARCSRSMEDLG